MFLMDLFLVVYLLISFFMIMFVCEFYFSMFECLCCLKGSLNFMVFLMFFVLFRVVMMLIGFYFVVIVFVGMVFNVMGFSVLKYVFFWEFFWFLVVVNMLIMGMNLSFMLNSVGFY